MDAALRRGSIGGCSVVKGRAGKPVDVISRETGLLIASFSSASAAGKEYGLSTSSVTDRCEGLHGKKKFFHPHINALDARVRFEWRLQ